MIINPTTNMNGEITLLGAVVSIASCIILVVILEIFKYFKNKKVKK